MYENILHTCMFLLWSVFGTGSLWVTKVTFWHFHSDEWCDDPRAVWYSFISFIFLSNFDYPVKCGKKVFLSMNATVCL